MMQILGYNSISSYNEGTYTDAKKTVSIHPKIVAEQLGYSGITIILNLYSHVVPGMQAAATSRLDDMVFKKENKLKEN